MSGQLENEPEIAGYDYGRVGRSPPTMKELEELKQTVGWTGEDEKYLRRAGEVLAGEAEKMVDAWRKKIGEQPHLFKWFGPAGGKPDEGYKAAVKKRFVQ